MIPINTVQFTELENITHGWGGGGEDGHPLVFQWVQNLLLKEFTFTSRSVCAIISLPTFFCSWNVHF